MMRAADVRAALAQPWVHGEAVDLRRVTVNEPLDLSGLALRGFDFRGSTFECPVTAHGARFDGLAWFGGCRFARGADFSEALFLNDARFEDCIVDEDFDLARAEFHGIARFDRARFVRRACMTGMTCFGNLSLDHAEFGLGVDLAGSECLGGFWANAAQFGAGSDFSTSEIHGRLWLRGARDGNGALTQDRFGLRFGYTYS